MRSAASIIITASFAGRVLAAVPLDSDPIPEAEKECGKDYRELSRLHSRVHADDKQNLWLVASHERAPTIGVVLQDLAIGSSRSGSTLTMSSTTDR
jgi:hypothetical protein